MSREVEAELRVPLDVLYRRLSRKVHQEEVPAAVVLNPFLGGEGSGHQEDQRCNDSSRAHANCGHDRVLRPDAREAQSESGRERQESDESEERN